MGDLSCSQLKSVIGLSNDRNHWLSTVECECRLVAGHEPQFACYSLCDGPKYGSRCEASFSILNSCPTYKNCGTFFRPSLNFFKHFTLHDDEKNSLSLFFLSLGNWTQSNSSDSGAISCQSGDPVPEAVSFFFSKSDSIRFHELVCRH